MPYLLLVTAILAEVFGTSLLRSTEGFSRLWPTVACLSSYAVAILLLSRVVQDLPVGVAYALWSGIGTVLVVAIAVTVLGDPLTWQLGLGIGLVVAGVVLLNLNTAA
ncbi:MAG: multidrug efflux SMR transporter [Nocardioidaceae bacterium]|nr:multidrug efflux SMR transporter [Nocardioidaceae bacterium]